MSVWGCLGDGGGVSLRVCWGCLGDGEGVSLKCVGSVSLGVWLGVLYHDKQ